MKLPLSPFVSFANNEEFLRPFNSLLHERRTVCIKSIKSKQNYRSATTRPCVFTNDTETIFITGIFFFLSSITRATFTWNTCNDSVNLTTMSALKIVREKRRTNASNTWSVHINFLVTSFTRTQIDDKISINSWWFTHRPHMFLSHFFPFAIWLFDCCVHFCDYRVCWANHLFMHFICNCLFYLYYCLVMLSLLVHCCHIYLREK